MVPDMELDQYLGQIFEQRSRGPGITKGASVGFRNEPNLASTPAPGVTLRLGVAGPSGTAEEDHYRQIKRQLHAAVVDRLNVDELNHLPDDQRRPELRTTLEKILESGEFQLDLASRRRVIDELLDDMLGFGPLEPLLRDQNVGDILINGTWGMFVEYGGVLREVPNPFLDTEYLT